MADPTKELITALRLIPLDELAAAAVGNLEGLRSAVTTIALLNGDAVAEATSLHRFSLALDRLQREVAQLRDAKLAQLRDDQKWTIGRIAKHTTIERTLVQKLIVKGRRGS